jgi:hypothetical protein
VPGDDGDGAANPMLAAAAEDALARFAKRGSVADAAAAPSPSPAPAPAPPALPARPAAGTLERLLAATAPVPAPATAPAPAPAPASQASTVGDLPSLRAGPRGGGEGRLFARPAELTASGGELAISPEDLVSADEVEEVNI